MRALRLPPLLLGVALAFAAVALAALPVRAADPCGNGLVARIQSDYQALKAFQAQFTQVDHQADGRVVRAQGTVSYLKPGRMRWEYAPPNEQLLVTDGKTVWLYDPILDNVTVQPLAGLTQGTPLAFLLGVGNLQKDFTCRPISAKPGLAPPKDGLAYVELVPREPIPTLAAIQLGAPSATGRLTVLRMIDGQGSVREVRFSQLRTNPTLDPEDFTFVVEPGMEVIRKEGP